MERFAFKIDSSLKSRLYNLCRLCGMDHPEKIPILDVSSWNLNAPIDVDSEPELSRKIYECVGIEVLTNDKMPPCICMLCCDKINDFYEYREMCHATDIQTRKLLGLPETPTGTAKGKKSAKPLKGEPNEVESIFGVVGDEVKTENDASTGSKVKKVPKTKLILTKNGKVRKLTKHELEIAMELERIKNEEEMETTQSKVGPKFSKGKSNRKSKTNPGIPLLTAKQPNKREKLREKEQKRTEKKRKRKEETKATPAPKKIKKEPGVICSICSEQFTTAQIHSDHLITKHSPRIWEFGCSSCCEQFSTDEENKLHHDWHKMFNIAYKCGTCPSEFDRINSFQRHVSTCTDHMFETAQQRENIFCGQCEAEFVTQNLYDWHDCFIRDKGRCSKCDRQFTKKTILFKHVLKCTGPPTPKPQPVIQKPPSKVGRPKKKKSQSDYPIKAEPEAILEPLDTVEPDTSAEHFEDTLADTHFGDENSSDSENETTNIPVIENTVTKKAAPTKQESSTKRKKANEQSKGISKAVLDCLIPCQVKLEPIDINEFSRQTKATANQPTVVLHGPSTAERQTNLVETNQPNVVVHNANAIMRQPSNTVHPNIVTKPVQQPAVPSIKIKQEKLHPGYGDVVFDPALARNIKKEKVDHSAPKQPREVSMQKPSTSAIVSQSKKQLYKKPALLAIKIKQERMEREFDENIDSHSNSNEYINQDEYDTSLPPLPTSPTLPSEPQVSENLALPVIASICSATEIRENIQIPVISSVIAGDNIDALAPIFETTENKIPAASAPPFKTIRIKREPPDALLESVQNQTGNLPEPEPEPEAGPVSEINKENPALMSELCNNDQSNLANDFGKRDDTSFNTTSNSHQPEKKILSEPEKTDDNLVSQNTGSPECNSTKEKTIKEDSFVKQINIPVDGNSDNEEKDTMVSASSQKTENNTNNDEIVIVSKAEKLCENVNEVIREMAHENNQIKIPNVGMAEQSEQDASSEHQDLSGKTIPPIINKIVAQTAEEESIIGQKRADDTKDQKGNHINDTEIVSEVQINTLEPNLEQIYEESQTMSEDGNHDESNDEIDTKTETNSDNINGDRKLEEKMSQSPTNDAQIDQVGDIDPMEDKETSIYEIDKTSIDNNEPRNDKNSTELLTNNQESDQEQSDSDTQNTISGTANDRISTATNLVFDDLAKSIGDLVNSQLADQTVDAAEIISDIVTPPQRMVTNDSGEKEECSNEIMVAAQKEDSQNKNGSTNEIKLQFELNANESASMQQTANLLKLTNDVLELDAISDASMDFSDF